mgnify:CR=1 FL=1
MLKYGAGEKSGKQIKRKAENGKRKAGCRGSQFVKIRVPLAEQN